MYTRALNNISAGILTGNRALLLPENSRLRYAPTYPAENASMVSKYLAIVFMALMPLANTVSGDEQSPSSTRPLRVLIVTGGCCHDYEFQTRSLQDAAAREGLEIQWKVVHEGGNGTQAKIGLYDDPSWAKDFDCVVHNECFADTKDPEYIRKITDVHRAGVHAVVIHCAMHTYRAAEIDDWRQFLGVTSRRHDHQSRYPVTVLKPDHVTMQAIPSDYVTPKDELYIIEKVWPNTTVLAESASENDGVKQPVFWTNQFGKARVFGTTYGHSNETFSDAVFLRTLLLGIQWAAGSPEASSAP